MMIRNYNQKSDRWEKIMLEAAQQCGRNQLPTLVVGEKLSQVLEIEDDALKLVAYENEEGHTIKTALESIHSIIFSQRLTFDCSFLSSYLATQFAVDTR